MQTFRAFRIHEQDGGVRAGVEQLTLDDLSPGQVLIRNRYSSVNFKDALAATGRAKILRRFPLVGGIDACGEVAESDDAHIKPGEQVLVTGYGLSDTHDGGYAEWLRVPADWVVKLPSGLTPFEAMGLGTAGFTAALAIHKMELNGQMPMQGPIAITGASGGVGCIAVDILSARGYEVVAISGKPDQAEFLRDLGAAEVLDRHQLALGTRPLEKGRWGGAIDCVGGDTLAWLTRTLRPWGNIASIGQAGGTDLHTTVMPFIIRGVNLLGINSSGCPIDLRRILWSRLAGDLKPPHLEQIASDVIGLDGLAEFFARMLAGQTRGRTVVDLSR